MELDLEARRILELTRQARTPSPGDKLRVEQALATSLGFAALSGVATAAASKATPTALAFKLTIGSAVVALVGASAGYLHWRAGTPSSSEALARAAASAPARSEAAKREPEPGHARPNLAELPAISAQVADVESIPKDVANQAAARRPPAREKPSAQEATLNQELDLLHDAQAQWRSGNPTAALSLLALHRQRYPKSQLRPEREALRVLSLCAVGRKEEARQVARRSLQNAPLSPLRTSVEESCVK
jgi:hypothetical protein